MNPEAILRSVPLFSGLDGAALSEAARASSTTSYRAGEVIVRQDEQGAGLHVIAHGQVEVARRNQGADLHLGRMGSGEVFGELAMLTDCPSAATVWAVEATTCIVIPGACFLQLADSSPRLAMTLARMLAGRLVAVEDLAIENFRLQGEVEERDREIAQLKIEIDGVLREKQVREIVTTDFFQSLQARAKLLRSRHDVQLVQEEIDSLVKRVKQELDEKRRSEGPTR